jgi:hypothetical protein
VLIHSIIYHPAHQTRKVGRTHFLDDIRPMAFDRMPTQIQLIGNLFGAHFIVQKLDYFRLSVR